MLLMKRIFAAVMGGSPATIPAVEILTRDGATILSRSGATIIAR